MDAAVAGASGGLDALTPSRQWRIGKRHRPPGLVIPVGRLAGIDVGSRFALLVKPTDKTEQALGYAEVETARELSADLRLVALHAKPVLKPDVVPPNAYARLLNGVVDFQVRIARPLLFADASEKERAAADLVERIARAPSAPGIGLRWVRPGEAADLRLAFTPRGPGDCDSKGIAGQRLWIAEADGGIRCRGGEPTIAIELDQRPGALERELWNKLQSMAKVLNLNRIAAELDSSSGEARLDVELRILPAEGAGQRTPMNRSSENIPEPRPGDGVRIDLMNSGSTPLDVTVLFVDGRCSLWFYYVSIGYGAA